MSNGRLLGPVKGKDLSLQVFLFVDGARSVKLSEDE